MKQLESKSSNYIIDFNEKDYRELVTKNPRPYDVVMLFNVKNSKCEHCRQVEEEYIRMVYSFIKSRG